MADPVAHDDNVIAVDSPANPGADIEMSEANEGQSAEAGEAGEAGEAAESSVAAEAARAEDAAAELPFAESSPVDPRTSFISYLMSPVVALVVTSADGTQTRLGAHQALLNQSPFLKARCAEFSESAASRQLDLPGEEIDAVGCFLEYLYTGEYVPHKVTGQRTLEADPSMPAVDDTGEQLLKHARIYTLADKWGIGTLKALATSKIHCVNSTAKGEIAYARYVYTFTKPDDSSIRAPVANFWATRSHTLRSEAEEEFKSLCLEFPQFGYDVLTRVLDEKLKRERNEKMHPSSGAQASTRKRARHSNM